MRAGRLRLGLLVALAVAAAPALAQDAPGITTPTVFSPFDPAAPACTPPPGLNRTLVFTEDNNREFMQGVEFGLSAAAVDRGLDYKLIGADNDPQKQATAVDQAAADHVGALVTSPIDAIGLAPGIQHLIATGAYVGSVVPPPATELLNAPQYLTGKTLADAAAAYIDDKLGGRANVVLLTHDSLSPLAPRFAAMRDVLTTMPGVTIVADISPSSVDESGGKATMGIVLLAHPDIDVVLGADTVVLGALQALREAHQDRPDQFLGGIDGEPEAVTEIEKGDGPYKATVSLASPVFSYAMGQHAADWLEGKSVPQAMDILPTLLTKDNLPAYRADMAHPGAVYADPVRRDAYLRMYGNICYDTRTNYVNFPWSSEDR